MAYSSTVSNPLLELARITGSRLRRNGFTRFQNGGTPLLERRRDDWIQEIVFRPVPAESGIRVTIHVGNSALRELRTRYWEPASRAPLLITAGDIGELELPPRTRLWTPNDTEHIENIAEYIEETALPWFSKFRDDELLDRLIHGSVTLIDTATALELSLLLGGPSAARRYIAFQFQDMDPLWREIEFLHSSPLISTEHLSPLARIAKIANSYRLLD